MRVDPGAPPDLKVAVSEFRLAMGQLLRRMRGDVVPGDLTLSQSATLARLEIAGWATTADLARAECVKPQSMAAILAGLEQNGMVQRKPHPTDGRQILFSLTVAGVATRRKRSSAKHDWLLAEMAKLDPAEQRTFVSAIALFKRLGEA